MNLPFQKLPMLLVLSAILTITTAARVLSQDTSTDPTSGGTDPSLTTDPTTTNPTVDETLIDSSTPTTDPTAPVTSLAPDATSPTTEAATSGSNIPADYDGPVGVTGIFNGNITTGCSYDPLTHSAKRTIDDIVVPGAIGKYPLKLTRYYNSRLQYADAGLSPGWRHEYSWLATSGGDKLVTPSGAAYDYRCDWPIGVSEHWEPDNNSRPDASNGYSGTFRLADGGKVVFASLAATYIYDPYGQRTTITRTNGLITRVTEPGDRYLQFYYQETDVVAGITLSLLTRVEAHGLGNATVTDWVNYSYTQVNPGGSAGLRKMLTGVTYSDGTSASYSYQVDNVTENPPTTYKMYPLLTTATDVRYKGPMRQISYIYDVATFPQSAPHGAILRERGVNGTTYYDVSKIQPALLVNRFDGSDPPTVFTETRGDSPIRTFTYSRLRTLLNTEGSSCPDYIDSPHQQLLLAYTDFYTPGGQGHTTSLGYNAGGFVDSVTDANNYTTSYIRGSIGEVTQITHPDTTHIDYTYTADPHYVASVTDERGNKTAYARDPTTHQITRISYQDSVGTELAFEAFVYNTFGQVTRHRLKNGAYVHYQYSARGLLTAKWQPTLNSTALTTDPKITYTYYTAADGALGWIDRVKTETLPANVSGYVAAETYEYDRNASSVAVAGRGQVTKITHADGWYKAFDYDNYGNKVWERDETNFQTRFTYDVYNRMLTSYRVMVAGDSTDDETTTYTYAPSNGTNTSPLVHTTSNPDTVKTPTGIITKYDYDQNYRKISATEAYGNALAATTTFGYDLVGNPTRVTDPLNHITATTYDTRNRKKTVTRASGTTLANTTTYTYDGASNVTRIDYPDDSWELNTYDALNRVTVHRVPFTSTVNIVTTFTLNPSGTIQQVTDGKGQSTTFLYDESDRKTKMTYETGEYRTWTYDDVGNLASRTTTGTATAPGETQSFGYNSRNFKTSMTWSNTAEWQIFTYDAAGRIATAKNGTGAWNTNIISTVTRSYDQAGRLILDRQALTGLTPTNDVNFDYNKDGNRTRLWATGAGTYDYTFSYDARGRFEKIFRTGRATPDWQYSYDAASNETQRLNVYNGINQKYTRDVLDRLTRRDVLDGATNLSYEIYTRDPMGRVTLTNRGGTNDDNFVYYLDGEMNSATYGTGLLNDVTYNLDRAGNRTSIVDGGVTKTYTPNTINQYSAAEGSAVTNGSEHEIASYLGVNYTYVNDGQLARVSNGTSTIDYAYDALGRCVKRTFNGGFSWYYIYDGERPILGEIASGWIGDCNIYGKGIDEILEHGGGGVDDIWHWTFYNQDANGNVTHLTDATGAVVEKYQYDAFGAPIIYNGAGAQISGSFYYNRFLFTGREYESSFGIYHYRARAYHPRLGRFMSEDPKLFDAGDYNLFRYCHNDPVDLTDPMGLEVDNGALAVTRDFNLHKQVDESRGWVMNNNGTWRSHENGPLESATGGNVPTMPRIGVTNSPKPPPPVNVHRMGPVLLGNHRLGVGNRMDAKWLAQFGPSRQEAASMRRFADVTDKVVGTYAVAGVAGPAAAEFLPGSAAELLATGRAAVTATYIRASYITAGTYAGVSGFTSGAVTNPTVHEIFNEVIEFQVGQPGRGIPGLGP